MMLPRHVARIEIRRTYIILVVNPKRKKRWWEHNIKIELKETDCEFANRIQLSQDWIY
jgi:hypothetical protein